MKRLAWLLLAVFCAALAQVQPVDGLAAGAAKQPCCCCCGGGHGAGCCNAPGACGTPSCCPAPASLPAALGTEQSARVAGLRAVRQAQPACDAAEKFYASFVEPAAVRAVLQAAADAAPPAPVPLFKAQCSYLI